MGLVKLLVIAQNPGPGQDFRKKDDGVRGGSTIGKMYEWMDWIGVNFFSFSNTYPHPGQFTKKDIDYDRLYTISKGYNKVIALGNVASEALAKINIDHFKLPHPSGLNRKLNDKVYVQKVLSECKEYYENSNR